MRINDNVYYVGVNDRTKHRFEGLWPLPYGVSYNSYLIVDHDAVALVDTVDVAFWRIHRKDQDCYRRPAYRLFDYQPHGARPLGVNSTDTQVLPWHKAGGEQENHANGARLL